MILGIYGSGGLGRELAEVAEESNCERRWSRILFIDDINNESSVNGFDVYRFEDFVQLSRQEMCEVVIAVGEPSSRNEMYERVVSAGLQLANLIHPSASLPKTCTLGKGSMLLNGARISPNTVIGNNVLINYNCNIGHDCQIGDNSVISTFVAIGGGTSVGSNSFVGMGSILRDHISIGNRSIVSMGSQVFHDVPDGVAVFGSPARPMRSSKEGVFHN